MILEVFFAFTLAFFVRSESNYKMLKTLKFELEICDYSYLKVEITFNSSKDFKKSPQCVYNLQLFIHLLNRIAHVNKQFFQTKRNYNNRNMSRRREKRENYYVEIGSASRSR